MDGGDGSDCLLKKELDSTINIIYEAAVRRKQ